MGFLLICTITGFALGTDVVIPPALLAGVVQNSGWGLRGEGQFIGWWSFTSKLNLALAASALWYMQRHYGDST
jgi:hypothetical protein